MNELNIHGVVGEGMLTSAEVSRQLAAMDQTLPLKVSIDSPGGDVLQGFSIQSALSEYEGPKTFVIESFAGSIASYILTAKGGDIEITANGYVMIHNPIIEVAGDDEELRNRADFVAKAKADMIADYSRLTGMDADEVLSLMKAETFFNATESVDAGFAHRVRQVKKPSSVLQLSAYATQVPHKIIQCLGDGPKAKSNPVSEGGRQMAESSKPATVQDIRAAHPKASSDFILSCIERQLPVASVAAAAAEELMAENEQLKAEMEAMKEDHAKALAEYETKTMEEEEAKAKAMEEEEAKAKAMEESAGNPPVDPPSEEEAPTATAQWKSQISARCKDGMPRAKAVQLVNRDFPGLRERMLEEANA